jgi:hypothetical protein
MHDDKLFLKVTQNKLFTMVYKINCMDRTYINYLWIGFGKWDFFFHLIGYKDLNSMIKPKLIRHLRDNSLFVCPYKQQLFAKAEDTEVKITEKKISRGSYLKLKQKIWKKIQDTRTNIITIGFQYFNVHLWYYSKPCIFRQHKT